MSTLIACAICLIIGAVAGVAAVARIPENPVLLRIFAIFDRS